ncbi:MAG: hypothetical protein ABI891_14365 [Acidobacteriota bacterium]
MFKIIQKKEKLLSAKSPESFRQFRYDERRANRYADDSAGC